MDAWSKGVAWCLEESQLFYSKVVAARAGGDGDDPIVEVFLSLLEVLADYLQERGEGCEEEKKDICKRFFSDPHRYLNTDPGFSLWSELYERAKFGNSSSSSTHSI